MEVCSAYGSGRKLRFIICSLLLFSNIGYISMTSEEGEGQTRGRVMGPVASEKTAEIQWKRKATESEQA